MIDSSMLEQFDIRAMYILFGLILGVIWSYIGLAAEELMYYLRENRKKSK